MELACCRDMLWENSMQGYNDKNIRMYDPIPQSHRRTARVHAQHKHILYDTEEVHPNFPSHENNRIF